MVLVVDDHEENAYVLCRLLTREGYQTTAVSSGPAALEFLRDTPVKLVILDYHMPEMDGLAVFRAMKADPTLRSVPVIFFSAYDGETREQALREGVVAWVVKGSLDAAALQRHIIALIGPGIRIPLPDPIPPSRVTDAG